jgi:hypothetical protein
LDEYEVYKAQGRTQELATVKAGLATVPRHYVNSSHRGDTYLLPSLGEQAGRRVDRAKVLGYLVQVEELPQWGTKPCPECPPGTPWLSEEGHRAIHRWRALCRGAKHPFFMITIYQSPSTAGKSKYGTCVRKGRAAAGGGNGVVLLDVETMEPSEGKTVYLTLSERGFPVREALKAVGIKARVTQVDDKRMRVDLAGKDAVFAGLLAVDGALNNAVCWRESVQEIA